MTLNAVDNGASFAGLYGLSNPTVTWLISRGYGELVALTPEEMRKEERPPSCRARQEKAERNARGKWVWRKFSNTCGEPMRYRPAGWVCYEHETPVRAPRPPRLQETPKLIDWGEGDGPETLGRFSVDELLLLAELEVDVVYTKDDNERRPSWKYVVRR